MNILVLGLGNELLRDDGVGVHLARELARGELPSVRIVDVGTAVLQVLDDLEWADHVIGLDAMKAGGQPGSVYVLPLDQVKERSEILSLHEVDLLAVAHFLDPHAVPEITIIGIEPESIEYGLELSDVVLRAFPQAQSSIKELIAKWSAEA